jgi:hypothetical protein
MRFWQKESAAPGRRRRSGGLGSGVSDRGQAAGRGGRTPGHGLVPRRPVAPGPVPIRGEAGRGQIGRRYFPTADEIAGRRPSAPVLAALQAPTVCALRSADYIACRGGSDDNDKYSSYPAMLTLPRCVQHGPDAIWY